LANNIGLSLNIMRKSSNESQKKNSRVLAAAIITIEKEDLKDYQVTLPEDIMARVDSALMVSLDLEKYKRA